MRYIVSQTKMVVLAPVMNVGTESYEDNQLILWLVKMQLDMHNESLTHAFVIGDQQTYERLIHMKEANMVGYDWLIPFPGEFHFAMHMIDAEYSLFWEVMLQRIAILTRKLKIDVDKVDTDFNRHEIFYQTVAQAVWEWFCEVFGNVVYDTRRIKELVKDNYTVATLANFLFDGALVYWDFKDTLRRPPNVNRRRHLYDTYKHMLWRFRATNKRKYAILCITALHTWENLTPELQELWGKVYSANLKGHPGRAMGIDALVEQVNREAKELVGDLKTEDRIAALVPTLNVLMPIEREHDRAHGAARFNAANTGLPILNDDVDEIKRLIYMHVGETQSDASRSSSMNMFTGNYDRPEIHVQNRVEAHSADWSEYVRDKLDKFNWQY